MIIRSTARRTLTSQGFTLIELMIALALGLLIIGATVTVFLSNQQTSRTMTELGNAQEAFRFASQTIMRVVQQGRSMRDPGPDALLRVVIAPGEGKMDCLGRPVGTTNVDSIINTFSINDGGELLCRVEVVGSDGITVTADDEEVLVEGLDPDPARTEFTFGVAEVADGYWRDNTLWGEAGDVDDWLNVRSVRVQLAKQAGGEAIGATAVFSATMRCAALGC